MEKLPWYWLQQLRPMLCGTTKPATWILIIQLYQSKVSNMGYEDPMVHVPYTTYYA